MVITWEVPLENLHMVMYGVCEGLDLGGGEGVGIVQFDHINHLFCRQSLGGRWEQGRLGTLWADFSSVLRPT